MATAERDDFKEMELWEHLSELRIRLMRSIGYVVFGMAVAWLFYSHIYHLLWAPMEPLLKKYPNVVIRFTSFYEPFMLQLQLSFLAGLIIAIPLVTLEIWGFVAPGLTQNEKKACKLIFPLSLFFFALGIFCGYLVMRPSMEWFLSFLPPDAGIIQTPTLYLTFLARLVLAFGISFQLPLILMLLSYIGLLSSQSLKSNWRIWIVVCATIGCVATPGGDWFSMALLSLSLVVLYITSIYLCQLVERFKTRQAATTRIGA